MPKMGTVTIWEKELNPNQSHSPCSGNIFYTRMYSIGCIPSAASAVSGGVLPGGGGVLATGVFPGGGASQRCVWSGGGRWWYPSMH